MNELLTGVTGEISGAIVAAIIAAVVSVIVGAIISAVVSMFVSARIANRKQRKLADAIKHHIKVSIQSLTPVMEEKNINMLKAQIENDAGYMPYASWSTKDDLTYEQVIDALQNLNDDEEQILLSYFHSHQTVHGLVSWLSLDFVRAFPTKQKLGWLEWFEHYGKETLFYAKQAQAKNLFNKKNMFARLFGK